AIDAIENSRETVLSLFELYTTRASHRMNNLMKRLTFVTVIVGSMSVIAGILGMNFEAGIFKAPNGFLVAIIGMGLLGIGLTITAKFMDWI
ncbi:MAG: magnesium transporter CorA, partial [Acidobacteriota bacterium]|nr:magnesium transporter CorA [Acidobacteriota bacterium]